MSGINLPDMEASNPLSVVQTTSPSLATTQPSSLQAGPVAPASIPSPQVSAMMQFNLQQTLLLQQYALSQQAVSKAVKSPAEVAAARAAEISKQLEGSGAAEKKTSERSKTRSTSKSASRSCSRSKSKSKSKSRSPSRSPIKRRRGRSRSLSPIRYRRDYYSSYRSRDHYGYRGHNYRSYYRGSYNDYSRYRYGRDYDYHYRRRSRSRERRRSRTRSRSPRRDRSRGRRRSPTLSPPPKRSSHTESPKDSRKGSVSPSLKRDRSRSRHTSQRSLSREAARSLSISSESINVSPTRSISRSVSPEKSVSDHVVDKSPLTESSNESDKNQAAASLRRQKKGSGGLRGGRMELSSSPTRSLSISLDNNDKYTDAAKEATAKNRLETSEGGPSDEPDGVPSSPTKKYVSEDSEVRKNYPGHGRRGRKSTRSSDAISDDSKSESMDDWRDDLKKVVKGKGISAKEGEAEGRGNAKHSETLVTERGSSLTVIASDYDLKQELIVLTASSAALTDTTVIVGEPHDISDEGHGHVVVRDDEPLEQVPILVEPKEVSDEDNDCGRLLVKDLIFEGPQPANVAYEERKQTAQFVDAGARKVHRPIPEKRKTEELSIARDDDDSVHHSDCQIRSNDDKDRDRSRSRDSKKHEAGSTKHERHRGKHKRHKKRHKHETLDEDSEGARKRHKRKQRRESDHGHKDRKKRRHKRRSRLSSVSEENSSADGEFEVRSSSGKRKRSSKKRKASKRDVSESSTSSPLG